VTLTTDETAPADAGAARDLSALFAPSSVAVVGASNDHAKYGNWISVQALRTRDVRPAYLVNRRGERVLGEPSYRRLTDVPSTVDLVVIAVPAAGFEEAVEDALAAGARAIVGVTSGFAELGAEGAARQAAIVRRVRKAGSVLLGPNCLGVVDTTNRLQLCANAMPVGAVGLISQSGNVALELRRFFEERGLGLSRFASLGNQADLTVIDLLRSYATHPRTDMIAVYCEDFVDGRAFSQAAAGAVEAGKRVVLLTVGSSQASARGARSHTGALTSDASAVGAACAAAGMDQVTSAREMADLLAALHAGRRPRGARVAVLADGGGHAALASDLAQSHGLEVAELAPSLVEALRGELPPSAGVRNPVDLAGAGERDIASFARTLDRLLSSRAVDSVFVTGYFGGYSAYGAGLAAAEVATARLMGRHAAAHGKPVLVHAVEADGPVADALRAAGIPVFRAAEDAARTLGLLTRGARACAPGVPRLPAPAEPVADDGYWTARELLRAGGVAFPAARIVRTEEEAAAAAADLGPPVVLKALGLLHKSDVGGVALDLSTERAVRTAYRDMEARLRAPGYCVERTADARGGVEVIVGVQRDLRFGPIAMVGLGGVFAEVLRDVAFALAPVDNATAHGLFDRLSAAALLRGARGHPAVDLDAAAEAVARITFVAAQHPEIAELEVNPLLCRPDGCEGLDARIVLAHAHRGADDPWTFPAPRA
jgi:acyl-CoA synthetase (NDP forming)